MKQTQDPVCHPLLSLSFVSQWVMKPAAAYCGSPALNVKTKNNNNFFTTREAALLFIVAPGLSVRNQIFLLMNVAFFFSLNKKKDQACRAFQCTSSLPRPFITKRAEGKGNWKVCSGNSADRRQTTCQVSRSCFVGRLICSSWFHESLCLPAMISEPSCIYNWMVIVKRIQKK